MSDGGCSGKEHPGTLLSLNNLAATRWALGDAEGARELLDQLVEVSRRVPGEEHPATVRAFENLAATRRERPETAWTRRNQGLCPMRYDSAGSMWALPMPPEPVISPYRGSAWRLWDLHVHTPESYQQDFEGSTHEEKWNKYLERLRGLDHVDVLGITDYCTIEGFLRVKAAHDAGEVPNIKAILPNLEFRLQETTRVGRNINIHVIASPAIAADLPNVLLARLKFRHGDELYTAVREDIVRLGKAYAKDSSLPERAAFMAGAEQFKVNREHLVLAFQDSQLLRDNALIALSNSSGDGNSGLRESGQRAQRQSIYQMCDIICSANPSDRDHFLGEDRKITVEEVRRDYGGRKACIGGSDSHRLEQIGRPDRDRFTWIRADPTFEGLLQICYEPGYRVKIAAERPPEPIHRIEAIELNVPDNTILSGPDGDEPFCFRGKRTIAFAPGLTCIIGGRGTGKSTLLSLLQEAAVGRSAFFVEPRELRSGDERLAIEDVVKLQLTSSADEIEFLDQNQIEAFALDHRQLTKAVYKRLEKLDDGPLANAAEKLRTEVEALQRLQTIIGNRYEAEARLEELQEEEESTGRLIESLKDEKYTGLIQSAERLQERLRSRRSARKGLADLVDSLERLIERKPTDQSGEGGTEPYAERAEALRAHVRLGVTEARSDEDLSVPSAAELEIQSELDTVQREIEEYLQARGISEENARDLANASDRLTTLREEIGLAETAVRQLRSDEVAVERADRAREGFEEAIGDLITPINENLRTGAQAELRRISIAYEFDRDRALESCLSELISQEAKRQNGRALRPDYVAAACAEVDWDRLPATFAEFGEVIRRSKGGEGESARRVIDFLREPGAYERFKLLVEERLCNALEFKRVEVRYDGKRLQQASFGQRCSAALIVLLMMGNQPIVIDEPEAHLDSALIASLLVNLIKKRKCDRQIIFATHNANFVVNGDAELIHVLSSTGANRTQVVSTSLENRDHRGEVLRLEGGEDAFTLREQRYGLRAKFARASM